MEGKRKRGGKKKTRKKKDAKVRVAAPHSSDESEDRGVESPGVEFGLAFASRHCAVQPLGNLLFTGRQNIRDPGLGSLQRLSDEIVSDILALLDAKDLARSGVSSKGFYVFSHQEALWRNLVLAELKGGFLFQGSWRKTYVSARSAWTKEEDFSSRSACTKKEDFSPVKVEDFYSDYLFQSWLCASVEIKDEWISRDNIERRSHLSVDDFVRDFERLNKPVLLTDAINNWPALKRWNQDYLLDLCGDVDFAAGPADMTLSNYFVYAKSVKEERPLYLFDPKFGEKVPQLAADYEVPVYFREDLFSILGKERPDYRWLILGPARSGSSFHIDPNSTSAWNAVVKGSKKWILYPPGAVPPGVHPSPDGVDVATPVSITEWFMNFYHETKRAKHKPVECVCKAGEVVFIPNGWWHIVINLEDSIAITQNYVSRSNILNVLDFLNKPNSQDLVSGTKDRVNLYDKFKSRYEELHPGSLEQLRNEKRAQESQKKRSVWESVTSGGDFRFNFGS
ncbi:hypothetical protein SELMODRAFT_419906 [Selaginella moellendorffii]|uniref:JmjC domain-containing protein n=1 Tax=Selaginella moellendorffii TaxID=88036 RepID=D8SAX2_SELML|nr:F-box protein At5g06550 [Selaginella moellendorffii]EFJ18505.1 hypothetical protein SELMODRAFT_419906 [Selaginella moellendorffii]|eukprot:XP_002980245.1 F-box protein At5g06550 [Selaginella moellendorffii]